MTTHLTFPVLLAAALGAGGDAGPLLDRVEAAGGDPQARDPLASLVLEGTIDIEDFVDGGPVRETYLRGDRALLRSEYPGIGEAFIGQDGDVCYTSDPAIGIAVREGEDGAVVRRMLAIFRRAPWRSIYAGAEYAGRETVGGEALVKVRMLTKEASADSSGDSGDTWWIDESEKRLVHVDVALPDPKGGELDCRYTFGDWTEVDGFWFPARREQRMGISLITKTFTAIEPGADVAPADVAPPDDIARAIEDPKLRADVARGEGEFAIEEVEERPVLSIRADVDAKEISRHLAGVFPEVMQAMSKQGGEFAAPPFSRYHDLPTAAETIDVEAGIPLRAAVEPDGEGRVKASTLPAGRVVTGWHYGPYEELPQTYERMQKWMESEELEAAGGPWEIYWTDPGLEPDPEKWKTQVFWPVK